MANKPKVLHDFISDHAPVYEETKPTKTQIRREEKQAKEDQK